MNTHLEILVKELIKHGVSAKCCEIITDNEGNVSASEPFLDFSEHDKKVAVEKDALLEEMRKNFLEVGRKKDAQIAELDRMRKSWMETAEKWSKLNKDLQDRVDSFEFAINQVAELEDRHQSDCIRINELLTTIDVLTERYQKLREVHGL